MAYFTNNTDRIIEKNLSRECSQEALRLNFRTCADQLPRPDYLPKTEDDQVSPISLQEKDNTYAARKEPARYTYNLEASPCVMLRMTTRREQERRL